jgi:hypothetical protein
MFVLMPAGTIEVEYASEVTDNEDVVLAVASNAFQESDHGAWFPAKLAPATTFGKQRPDSSSIDHPHRIASIGPHTRHDSRETVGSVTDEGWLVLILNGKHCA